MTNMIIFGASRGLGRAFATGLPESGDSVWLISRNKPEFLSQPSAGVTYHWIQADLTQPDTAAKIAKAVGENHIDLLLYNAGIWESTAFSQEYDFEKLDPAENQRVIAVNLTAAIDCVQKLLPKVRQAQHGKIVVIGSTSSLPNIGGPEIAYTASKFGILGMVHALREITRKDGIAVTCINPGLIATEIKLEDEAERLKNYNGEFGLPVGDLVKVVQMVLSLSPFACVKEINIPDMKAMEA
ncbi:MAG: SDR family NAD(P)-dependent oxidoreductase [Anaerolineae bacterium]